MTVPPRLSIVTLGVADLARSAAFYTALGWPKAGSSTDEIVWFGVGGCWLGLYGRTELAEDAGTVAPPSGYGNITLAVNVESEAAVDDALRAAKVAGATLAVAPARVDWGGYRGYFADPDGHHWEVAYNPFFPFDADGNVVIP